MNQVLLLMLRLVLDINCTLCASWIVRTTLNLDDDVLTQLKAYAEDRAQPLGKAASELIRRGLAARRPTRQVNGLQVFDLPAGSAAVSTTLVKRLEAEEDERVPVGR